MYENISMKSLCTVRIANAKKKEKKRKSQGWGLWVGKNFLACSSLDERNGFFLFKKEECLAAYANFFRAEN
jgi:hypothetical protein